MLRMAGGFLVFAHLAGLISAQDKPPTWGQVLSNMNKQKTYNFTLKGPLDCSGTYEKGAVHYNGGGVEVAGKGGITHASADGKWTSVNTLIQMGQGGETLKKMARLIPAHQIVPQIAGFAKSITGDGFQGFSGELAPGNISQLIRAPYLETQDLLESGGLQGRFAFSCNEGLIVKAEVQITGTKINWERRHYQGVPKQGDPPPTPPAANWKLGPDGYWYEGNEKSVAVSLVLEFKDFGSAKIADDVRGKIGLK